MDHEHSFPQDADNVEWNDTKDVLIVERNCECRIRSVGPSFGGTPNNSEKRCTTTQKTAFEIRSVTDTNNKHDNSFSSVIVSEKANVSDSSKHISDFDKAPDWVTNIISIVKGRARENSHIAHTTRLIGPQFSILIATSDGEYNVTFTEVDQWTE